MFSGLLICSLKNLFPTPEPWAGAIGYVPPLYSQSIHFTHFLLLVVVSSQALSLSPVNSGGAAPAKEGTHSSSPIYTREGEEDVQGPAQTFRNQM